MTWLTLGCNMIETTVVHPLDDEEATRSINAYVGSSDQMVVYETPTPFYARTICSLVSSMSPSSVFEFGCNGGRNLSLLRKNLPNARLVGVDINPKNVEIGNQVFSADGLHLSVGGVEDLSLVADSAFDVVLSVSVADHIPYPEKALRNLLRIAKNYLVLFEPHYDRIGKADKNHELTARGLLCSPAYRYSYLHDYRYEIEKKLGAECLLDAKFPIGEKNTLDLYRLYIFSKEEKVKSKCFIKEIVWQPLTGDSV